MGLLGDIIDSANEAFRFKDTIFLKEKSDLEDKLVALNKLKEEYPNNKKIEKEYYMVKKGLDGENEVAYELKKSNIGMYVLRDVKFKYESETAQIDYVIITPYFIYYVECKNFTGNITITSKGDFVLEKSNKERIGIQSPLRQVESQREVVRKVWESNSSIIKRVLGSKDFNYYRRVLVVNSNKNALLNTCYAPKDIKYKVLKTDNLVKQIEYDICNRSKDDLASSQREMECIALNYLTLSFKENMDFYNFYKKKISSKLINDEVLKEKLLKFRKERSRQMNIPAYYVFTNEELDTLIKLKPHTMEELNNILTDIKIKTHGREIIAQINEI